MTRLNKYWIIAILFAFAISCSDKPEVDLPDKPGDIMEGLTWTPESADADKDLTITFKAPKSSDLHGETGDVYLYAGVIVEGEWMFNPKEWTDNDTKYKMTKSGDNIWTIKLAPSIRSWFNSGETAVTKLGIQIRNADGDKKGKNEDSFIDVTDSKFKAFEPGAIKNAPLPAKVKEGINIIDNSTVTLVLYDKDKNGKSKDFAHVVGDFNNWKLSNDESSQMFRDEASGCWWITIDKLDPAKEYAFQYYVGTKGNNGETIRVADPYARKILDPDNDKYISASTYPENKDYPKGGIGIVSVLKTNPEVYNWKINNFEKPATDNLVIYEMLFRDFTESGDINGAMDKLDYLKSLGVNAIELMPTQEFDGNDSWGYNPAFFFAMDKAYGTDKMYKQFIDACHERGMAVILDVVYNHATGSNPFAKMWWNKNKTASNNPYFNVDAPHPYSVFHDFNHESELVQKFVARNLQFLLEEYNIDGFRFDLTKGFTQNESNESTAGNYDESRIAILKKYNDAVKTVKPKAYVILEHFADNREETELANNGMMVWRNMNEAYKQSAMGWSEKSSFDGVYYKTSSRPTNSLVSYMESHDEERMAFTQKQWGNEALKTDMKARMSQLSTNAAFFLTVPGPKMIWQFGEMGYDISIDENGRTGRKPIKWEYLQNNDRKELHDIYSKLIDLRISHSDLFNSTATMDWTVSTSNWDNGRFITLSSFGNAKQVVVVGNFTNSEIKASTSFPSTGTWYNYINGESIQVASQTMSVDVPANSFKMFIDFEF